MLHPPTLRSDKNVAVHKLKKNYQYIFLSCSCTISLAPTVSCSSTNQNILNCEIKLVVKVVVGFIRMADHSQSLRDSMMC